ncbi:MAG: methyltransferase domain-containing protein [Spartobacteria bacterium]|nr:methyltransferase domain-containing protein [Spartobacteria bacterium]
MDTPFNPSLHALSHSLDLLKDTYNYNHWIYSLLREHLGDTICEVGAGTGNLTQFFLPAQSVLCIEPEAQYGDALRRLAQVHLNLQVYSGGLADCAGARGHAAAFATVVCVNVLEHIEDDAQALEQMESLLQAGGRLLLYVPAGPWAYGHLDRQLGHFRRYSKRRIRQLAAQVGFELERCIYVNFAGVFGWFWHSRVLGRDVVSPQSAQFVDRLVPYLSAVERLVRPVVGQSLFAVLRKP